MATKRSDSDIIAQQVASFEPAAQASIIDAMLADRSPAPSTPQIPERTLLQRIEVEDEVPLVVTPSRVLVRSEHADRAAQLLNAHAPGWSGPTPVECGGDVPLGIARFSAPSTATLTTEVLDLLWDAGIEANFSYITPSGPFVKGGENTPEHPTGTVPDWQSRSTAESGMGVRIAVIDTGINCDKTTWGRAWLRGIARTTKNRDELNTLGGATLDAGAGHGTFVAGIVRQVAPDSVVSVYRALDSEGIGTEESVACAILQAAADGADIINLSLGTETYKDRPPVAIEAALEAIPDHVVVVAAAGNQGSERPYWPAAFKRVIAVAALDERGAPAPWSNRGPWVNMSTRGAGVVSTFVHGLESTARDPKPEDFRSTRPWAMWSGTSFAAPQIAGLIAVSSQGRTPREAAADLVRSGTHLADFGAAIATPLPYQGA
jgi:subtilisin family serine protease